MKNSSLYSAIAVLLGSTTYTFSPRRTSVASPNVVTALEPGTARSRNGGKPSGAARLKRSAKKLSMAKARASKR